MVFTGIDGSGKSSHARHLAAFLNELGEGTRYVHQFSPDSRFVGGLRSSLWDGLKKTKAMFAAGGPSRGNAGPRAFVGGTLTLLLGFYRTLAKLRSGRYTSILVFDRYFADEILRASFDYNFRPPWAWQLEAMLPSPDLVFYLDLPPGEALLREKDRDLNPDGIRRKMELYNRWARGVALAGHPPLVWVRTDRDAEEVQEEVVAHALRFLALKGHPMANAAPLPGYVGR